MVSVTLLHRGVFYFTVMGTNVLPLIKYGMDEYFRIYRAGTGGQCSRLLFPLVCLDSLGSEWTLYTELGAVTLVALLTVILVTIHTVISFYFFLFTCRGKGEEYLAGIEDGCCGAAAVLLSLASYDADVIAKSKTMAAKWRRATHFMTGTVQVVIIVAVCAAIRVVTSADSRLDQKDSLFVLLPCLFLNITSWIENMYDGMLVLYGD
ncbi:hypothetical protein BC831DRAFT_480598 [Entophlyctis helioformis]|nr:hypothetical protein BC831DRAFT_480598 [Entophlyctis helioformis]